MGSSRPRSFGHTCLGAYWGRSRGMTIRQSWIRAQTLRTGAVFSIAGFSLLELLVTIAVGAILATIAIPSYRSLVNNTSNTAQINELVGALNYARSTAVARGSSVAVCASSDQTHCENVDDWHRGWIVYVDAGGSSNARPTKVLRVHRALSSGVHLINDASHPISFNSSGFNMDPHKWVAHSDTPDQSRAICVAATGRIRVADTADCS